MFALPVSARLKLNPLDLYLIVEAWTHREKKGGIPYTPLGAQIPPPLIIYFSCFYAYFRLG